MVGRQERTLGLLSNIQSTVTVSGAMGGVAQGQPNGNRIISYLCTYCTYPMCI